MIEIGSKNFKQKKKKKKEKGNPWTISMQVTLKKKKKKGLKSKLLKNIMCNLIDENYHMFSFCSIYIIERQIVTNLSSKTIDSHCIYIYIYILTLPSRSGSKFKQNHESLCNHVKWLHN